MSAGGRSGREGGAGRTGARRPPAAGRTGGPGGQPRRQTATYRGIRWRKDPDGTIGWFNEGRGGWVRWRPGGDAPPVPPRWEADVARIPLPPRVRRASWRSPYRIVPVLLAVAAVVVGVLQATRTTDTAAVTANREAHALAGKCLAVTDHHGGAAVYGTGAVACTSSDAAVKVVAVEGAGAGPGSCPARTRALQLRYAGVRTPDFECVRATHPAHGG